MREGCKEVIIVPEGNSGIGGNNCWFRRNLFAAMSFKETAETHPTSDGELSHFDTVMAESWEMAQAGQRGSAIRNLIGLLRFPNLEVRQELWLWTALRELGVMPGLRASSNVLGAVLEVPTGNGKCHVMSAYLGGQARYLSPLGGITMIDTRNPIIVRYCTEFVKAVRPALARATLLSDLSLPRGRPRLTLLTIIGIFATDVTSDIIRASDEFMTILKSPHSRARRERENPALTRIMNMPSPEEEEQQQESAPDLHRPAGAGCVTAHRTQPAPLTFVCSECGEARSSKGYSRKVFKKAREDPQYKPTCISCRAFGANENAGDSAAKEGGAAAASELAPGCRVRLYGLQHASELNGQFGVLQSYVQSSSSWRLKLESGRLVDLKPGNFQVDDALKVADAIASVVEKGFHPDLVRLVARRGKHTAAESLHQAVLDKYKEEEDCGICSLPFGPDLVMIPRPCCSQVLCAECDEVCHGAGQPCAFCRTCSQLAASSSLGSAERARRALRYSQRR